MDRTNIKLIDNAFNKKDKKFINLERKDINDAQF